MADKDENGRKQASGGVRHDDRGNAVWQWAAESGRHAIDSTSRLLKRLEIPGLNLEDDKAKQADEARREAESQQGARAQPPDTEAGYDPYGGLNQAKRRPAPPAAPASTRPAAAKPAVKAAVKPAPGPGAGQVTKPGAGPHSRPSLWQRLFRKD